MDNEWTWPHQTRRPKREGSPVVGCRVRVRARVWCWCPIGSARCRHPVRLQIAQQPLHKQRKAAAAGATCTRSYAQVETGRLDQLALEGKRRLGLGLVRAAHYYEFSIHLWRPSVRPSVSGCQRRQTLAGEFHFSAGMSAADSDSSKFKFRVDTTISSHTILHVVGGGRERQPPPVLCCGLRRKSAGASRSLPRRPTKQEGTPRLKTCLENGDKAWHTHTYTHTHTTRLTTGGNRPQQHRSLEGLIFSFALSLVGAARISPSWPDKTAARVFQAARRPIDFHWTIPFFWHRSTDGRARRRRPGWPDAGKKCQACSRFAGQKQVPLDGHQRRGEGAA
jgi:hypothetical protein